MSALIHHPSAFGAAEGLRDAHHKAHKRINIRVWTAVTVKKQHLKLIRELGMEC